MHRTHTIQMTHEQLRVIEYALRHADMSGFVAQPEDDLDKDGSQPIFMADMAVDTLAEQDAKMLHGWAI